MLSTFKTIFIGNSYTGSSKISMISKIYTSSVWSTSKTILWRVLRCKGITKCIRVYFTSWVVTSRTRKTNRRCNSKVFLMINLEYYKPIKNIN